MPTNLLGHAAGAVLSGSWGRAVRSPYARARVYVLRMPGFKWIGGVALGHAIVLSPKYGQGLLARLVLAHELAHTRQHDLLGPLYLPSHALLQLVSALCWQLRPVPGSDPVHAHNPLEERWLFLPHHRLPTLARTPEGPLRAALEARLKALGV